jgi:hypothetical protein
MTVWLRITVYLSGLQIAMYWLKAMVRRTEDSRVKIAWIKNI